MTRLKAVVFGVGISLSGTALAGDCYNDDGAVRDDLEPAVLKVSDADIDALRSAIRAHERRMQAARKGVTTPANVTAPGSDGQS